MGLSLVSSFILLLYYTRGLGRVLSSFFFIRDMIDIRLAGPGVRHSLLIFARRRVIVDRRALRVYVYSFAFFGFRFHSYIGEIRTLLSSSLLIDDSRRMYKYTYL